MQITLRNEGVDVQCVYLDNTLVSWCCRRHCHVLSSKLCLNVQERCLVGEEQYEIASDMKFMTRSNLSDCKAFMQFGPPSKTSCHAVPVKAFSHCAKNRHAHRYRKSTRRHSSKGEEVKRETVDEHFWSEVEAAQEELTRLEREREDSLRKVRRFSKRTDRLFCSISGLYGEALRQVKSGNEEEARKSLMTKAVIVRATHMAQEKASVHSALARKLEEAIYRKQLRLLDKIIEAGRSLRDREIPS